MATIDKAEKLICKGENDVCRIYEVSNGYELRYNSIWYGDIRYLYKTLRGAKVAMARMAKGRYKDLKKPSTPWE